MKRSRDEATMPEVAASTDGQSAPPLSSTTAAPPSTATPASSSSSSSSSSPYALQFEVVYGITSRRSGSLEAERAAVLSRLLSTAALTTLTPPTTAVSSAAITTVDVAALLEDDTSVCLGGYTRELVYQQLLRSSQEGSLLRLLTVELVANDGHTLVLASPQTASAPPAGGTAEASASTAAPLLMDVAEVSAGSDDAVAHPADLVLLRCQPHKPLSLDIEEEGSVAPSSNASSTGWATHVEFLTYNTALFTANDVDLWRDAVDGSIAIVVRWVSTLLEQPPGLGQLAFLEAAASSLQTESSSLHSSSEGWRRTLQLPLLLRVKAEVMRSADAATLERLRRVIVFALRSLLGAFENVDSAMRLPHLCQRLAYLFLASPLFVDGASQVAIQLLSTDTTSATRQTMARVLHSCLQLGLQYASSTAALLADGVSSTAELHRSAQQTRNGYEVLLSRLSHVWLLHSASLKGKRASGGGAAVTGGTEAAVCEVLESVAATGILRQVERWLQLEEDLRRAHDQMDASRAAGGSGGADTADALAELLQPPTLRQVQDGRYLQDRTVAEQLTALRRTYNPYLSHEMQQFLRGTAIAAYAELYGNTARAVRRVTKLSEGATELHALGRLEGVIAVPLDAVGAIGLRAGGLGDYSLEEVQQHAAFGLPMRLHLRQQTGHQRDQLDTIETMLQGTRYSSADGSLFAYAMVLLNGQWIAFPLVLVRLFRETTQDNPEDPRARRTFANCEAHVLRDSDMLADFVLTSAAATGDGQAQAWIVVGAESIVQRRRGSRRRRNAAAFQNVADVPAERLLPTSTPALTYMDCLRRLHALAITVRQCDAGSNNSKGRATPSRAASGAFSPSAASGLWTEYFLNGTVPQQRYVGSLASPVIALLSGSGGTTTIAESSTSAASLQTLLTTVSSAVHFSSAQVEALYTLTAGTGLTNSHPAPHAAGPPTRPGALSSGGGSITPTSVPVTVKVVDGCTGSGKTSILYASSLVRGKVHAAARQEQQRSVQARLKHSIVSVRQAAAAVRRASVPDLFATSPEVHSGRSLLDEASRRSAESRQQYRLLNEGLLYCSTPLMLRPAAVTSTMPVAVEELLFASPEKDSGEAASTESGGGLWSRKEVNSLTGLLRESRERSLNAPLTAQLNEHLRMLLATGLWSGRCRAEEQVAAPLLALTMSTRDASDVMAHAASVSAAAVAEKAPPYTWAQYVAAEFWPEAAIAHSLKTERAIEEEEEEEDSAVYGEVWEMLTSAPDDRFTPVTMPATTRLSRLSAEQREGWHSVYLGKQADLAHHVHTAVHASVRSVFQYFLDLVFGVAAASQSTRHTLLTSTPVELTQGMQLPYLWCWQPSHVCIDDLDAVQDGIFAMLTPAASVIYSLTAEVPAFQERRRSHERVVLALLRSLRTELQRANSLTTTALRESLRCRRAEVQAVLRHTIEDARALAQSLSEAKARKDAAAAAARDGGAADGDADDAEREGTGEEKDKAGGGAEGEEEKVHLSGVLDLAAPPPAFPGLASYSAVEVWSHGVSTNNCIAADAAAAVFLMSYLSSYRNWSPNGAITPAAGAAAAPLSFAVYTSTAAAAEHVSEAIALSPALSSYYAPKTAQPPSTCSVRVWKESLEDMGNETSFAAATGAASVSYTSLEEAECETDVGVVCLSGLLDVVLHVLKNNPGLHRPDVRLQQWRQLWAEAADGSPSLFVTRLQWWLWRLLRRVRRGVVFIGSRELFACVPLFTKIESVVQVQRRLLSPQDQRAYWLPAGVGASVLALVCPDHYKCRRTATVQERAEVEDENGGAASDSADEPTAEVRTHGPMRCTTLCLKPYENCPSPSHACLTPCHVQEHQPTITRSDGANEGAAVDEDTIHACCPYPCGTVLPCGHTCHRICGAACAPCTYAGLTELSCGQRVVSGIDNNKVLQHAVFHHFQERRCGEPPTLCRTPVAVPCTRCGMRLRVPCYRVTSQQARRQHTVAESKGNAEATVDSVLATYVVGETACPGCVALYNKVAHKYGYELLTVPSIDFAAEEESADAAAEDEDGGDTPGTSLPRHTLSPEAQAELRREFAIAVKKTELLVMKEALEITNGKATEKTDYAVYRAAYEHAKATQAAQEKAWRDAYQATMDGWAATLRKALETQYALNTELDTLMPRLVSEAADEAEVQRLQFAE